MPTAQNELVNVLNDILKPFFPKEQEQLKLQLIKEVAEKLQHIQIDDLKHPDNIKALRITCGAHMMEKNNPAFKFDPTFLFKQPKDEKEEADDLKSVFKKLLSNMFKLTPKGKKKKKEEGKEEEIDEEEQKKLDTLAEALAMKVSKKRERTPVAKNESAMGLIEGGVDVLAAGIETQYGGVDVRFPGKILKPVLGVPHGDQMGTIDLATQEGTNFKASLEKTYGEDYTGIKLFNLVESVAVGDPLNVDEMCAAVDKEGILHSPHAPKPTMPGTKTSL
jgi:hypothetical protein